VRALALVDRGEIEKHAVGLLDLLLQMAQDAQRCTKRWTV
jgi:hypothetical protein